MAIVNTSVIEKFEAMTKFSLSSLFLRFLDFMNNDKANIIDFYSGRANKANESSFNNLKEMILSFDKLNGVIEVNKGRLLHTLYWELLESISDITISLETINNSSKWLRSTIAKNNFNPSVEVDYILKMFQTLENVSKLIQKSSDFDNEWSVIALRNDLREEDYNTSGGNILKLDFKNKSVIKIRSVVDTINGESVYGKDLDKRISIVDEDLKSLTPKETMTQTVEILSKLKQGDCPEFKGEGIQAGLGAGGNSNSITYPILFRQIFSTFRKDDTLKALKINNISKEKDSVSIELQVETRLGELFSSQIPT